MQIAEKKRIIATSLVVLLVSFCELLGLPGLGLSHPQEICLSILIIAAFLWVTEVVPLFVVSFLILAMELIWLLPSLNAAGHAPIPSSVIFEPFFSNIVLLFLGGFVLSSLMQKYGLDIKFAQAILAKTKGEAGSTLLGIILACSFLSMWVSNTATTAMMLAIVFPLLKHIPEDHSFRIALVLSIPFACNIGGLGTPIGTPPNAIALSYLADYGIRLSFVQWMMLMIPFLAVFLLVLWRLLLKMYPPLGLRLEIKERNTGDWGLKHWVTLVIFTATALGWFFGKQLGLKTGTIALLPIICSFWFGLLDTGDFRKLPWDILYIISGGLALGVALELSGLDAVLVAQLPADTGFHYLLLAGVIVAAAMSTIMSNTATAGLLIPLLISIDVSPSNLLSLILALAMMCSMAMALPVTTPPNAIAFSSRAIKSKDMLVVGGILTIVGLLIVFLLGPFYWSFALKTFIHL